MKKTLSLLWLMAMAAQAQISLSLPSTPYTRDVLRSTNAAQARYRLAITDASGTNSTVTGTNRAGWFVGDGSLLTGLAAADLTGSLTNWAKLDTNQMASGTDLLTRQLGSANLTNWSLIVTGDMATAADLLTRQLGSANLTNWSGVATGDKQNAFTTGTGVTNTANVLSANITPGLNVAFTTNANGSIEIAGSAAGEANTASNVGGGMPLYTNKAGVDLQFRTLTNANGSITITDGNDGTLTLNTAPGIFDNVYFGYSDYDTMLGTNSMLSKSGTYNTAVGHSSLTHNGSASGNTAMGYYALHANSSGQRNVAVGYEANGTAASGDENVAIGYRALRVNTGAYNVGVGMSSLEANTGQKNTAVGYNSLKSNTYSSDNTAVGSQALFSNTAGYQNVALGQNAGYWETTTDNLWIDNRTRGGLADGKTTALIYGKFADAVANQYVTINGGLNLNGAFNPASISLTSGNVLISAGNLTVGTQTTYPSSLITPMTQNIYIHDGVTELKWTLGTGWAPPGISTGAKHTAGNTAALTYTGTGTFTVGTKYTVSIGFAHANLAFPVGSPIVSWTPWTAGVFTNVTAGVTNVFSLPASIPYGYHSFVFTVTATATSGLVIYPASAFDGQIFSAWVGVTPTSGSFASFNLLGTKNLEVSENASVSGVLSAGVVVVNNTLAANSAILTNGTVAGNLGAILAVGSADYVDLDYASATNAIAGAFTILAATNGVDRVHKSHVRWFFNGSGSDQTLSLPSGWRTNFYSAVPAKLTNGTITKMIVDSGGPTGSAAQQTNCYVSFEYYQ